VVAPSVTQAVDPVWIGNRQHRILLEVKPSDIGSRPHDERPAEVILNFEEMISAGIIPQRADLSTLQLMRYDAVTGQPIPYKNNLYGETPYDLPLQSYDAAIPDPFADRDFGLSVPWTRHPYRFSRKVYAVYKLSTRANICLQM